MKNLLVALFLALPVSVQAQSISLPLTNTQLDLKSLVEQMHPCYIFDQHKDNLAGAYVVAADFHTAAGASLVQLNAGLAWEATGNQAGQGGPMLSIGIRADNLLARLDNDWIRAHVTKVKLPAVEVGPFGSYISRLGWLYGLFVSTKL